MNFDVEINLSDPTSIICYSNSLYAFKAYKVARNRFKDFKRQLSVPGVYILDAGQLDEKQHLYVGQSENLLDRLRSHNSKPPKSLGWRYALCFVKEHPNLKECDRLRIEKLLVVQLRRLDDRFKVYTEKVTSELFDQDAALNNAMREIISFLSVMGIDPYREEDIEGHTQLFYCKIPKQRDKEAQGYFSRGEFVVKAGSWVSQEKKTGFKPSSYWQRRQKLESDGVIKEGRFVRMARFDSVSAAAAVVCGCSANGLDRWLTQKDGVEISMKEFFEDNHDVAN